MTFTEAVTELAEKARKLEQDIAMSKIRPAVYGPRERQGDDYMLWRGSVCGARAMLKLIEDFVNNQELGR
jgi:hypothetical protein